MCGCASSPRWMPSASPRWHRSRMVTESNTPDTFDASSRQMSAGTFLDERAPAGVSSSVARSSNRPLHRADDVAERDRLGRAREEIAALGPALGVDDVGAAQLLEDLLEVAQRHVLAPRDVARLRGPPGVVIGDVEHRPHSISRFRRQLHSRLFRSRMLMEYLTKIVKKGRRPLARSRRPRRRARRLALAVAADEAGAGAVGAQAALLVVEGVVGVAALGHHLGGRLVVDHAAAGRAAVPGSGPVPRGGCAPPGGAARRRCTCRRR